MQRKRESEKKAEDWVIFLVAPEPLSYAHTCEHMQRPCAHVLNEPQFSLIVIKLIL